MNLPSHIPEHWACWFVGFVDGEGHLQIPPGGVTPRLVIHVRRDDCKIIEEIHSVTKAGSVYKVSKQYDRDNGKDSRDQLKWRVHSISDLTDKILPIFEFQLPRSKKYREYLIWKEAIEVMASMDPCPSRDQKMESLKQRLHRTRHSLT